jgi:magnesium chelatase subunit I
MIELLDEYIPFVTGSEINDDPFGNSRFAKILLLKEKTPISWLHQIVFFEN